jgi:hypothetical protein
LTKQLTFKIPIKPQLFQRFKFYHPTSIRSPFRQASIAAARDKLIQAIHFLTCETEKHGGYPTSAVLVSLNICQDALLLLSQVELDLTEGKRATRSVIGNPAPSQAEIDFLAYKQELLDARLAAVAHAHGTRHFNAEQLKRLAEIRPDLIASAPAGSSK